MKRAAKSKAGTGGFDESSALVKGAGIASMGWGEQSTYRHIDMQTRVHLLRASERRDVFSFHERGYFNYRCIARPEECQGRRQAGDGHTHTLTWKTLVLRACKKEEEVEAALDCQHIDPGGTKMACRGGGRGEPRLGGTSSLQLCVSSSLQLQVPRLPRWRCFRPPLC